MNELSRIQDRARRLRRAEDLFVYDLVNRNRWIGTPGQVITSEINFALLFDQMANQTTDSIQSETCFVNLHDPDSNQLWSLVSMDHPRGSIRVPAQCGIAGRIFENQLPQIVNPPYKDLKKNG